jgi:hypothetical protein
MAFNPDAYLANKAQRVAPSQFNPDAYLANRGNQASPEQLAALGQRGMVDPASNDWAGGDNGQERGEWERLYGLKDDALAAARGFASGSTAGLTEPLTVGLSTLAAKPFDWETPISEIYHAMSEINRDEAEKSQQNSPIASALGKVGGYVNPFGVTAKAIKTIGPATNIAGLVEAGAPGLGAAATPALGKVLSPILRGGLTNVAVEGLEDTSRALLGEDTDINPLKDFAVGGTFDLASSVAAPVANKLGNKADDYFMDKGATVLNKALKPSPKELAAGKNLGRDILERTTRPRTLKGFNNLARRGLEENENKLEGFLANADSAIDKETIIEELKNFQKIKQPFSNSSLNPEGSSNIVSRVDDVIDDLLKSKDAISAKEANQIKRFLYKDIGERPFMQGIMDNGASTGIDRAKAKGLRRAIEEAAPEVRGVNKELGVYGRLGKSTDKLLSRSETKNLVNPFDAVSATAGASSGGLGALIGFLGRPMLESPLAKSSIAQLLKLAGKAGGGTANAISKAAQSAPLLAPMADDVEASPIKQLLDLLGYGANNNQLTQ